MKEEYNLAKILSKKACKNESIDFPPEVKSPLMKTRNQNAQTNAELKSEN